MSKVTRKKAFDRAVDLVINQDHVVQQWTGRYIAIQTSLAIAAGTLLSWKGPQLGFIAVILVLVIGTSAIMLACALTEIIKREYEWQKRYVEMIKRTEGNDPFLYQKHDEYEPLPGKSITSIFSRFNRYIIGAWVVAILFVVLCQGLVNIGNLLKTIRSWLC